LRLAWIKVIAVVAVVFGCSIARAAPKAELWALWQKHNAASAVKIDHGAWDRFLNKHVIVAPTGINLVRYQSAGPEDQKLLKDYLRALQAIEISSYNRNEQKAYWINLYNAATVDLVLSRLPIASIRNVNISPGLFVRGPWGAKLLTVEGENLSLDDIEHRILRPIWKDSRVHYALNWASVGCPNLQPAAYTSDNIETLLEKGAREFINHPRGVSVQKGKLAVSSIYVWFQEDFGRDADELMEHWQKYASPALSDGLEKYQGALAHDYDWRLNGADGKP
jgi:hypothetical protein